MLFLCSWCLKSGMPGFMKEVEPYNNEISHGICEAHGVVWQAQAEELHRLTAAKASR